MWMHSKQHVKPSKVLKSYSIKKKTNRTFLTPVYRFKYISYIYLSVCHRSRICYVMVTQCFDMPFLRKKKGLWKWMETSFIFCFKWFQMVLMGWEYVRNLLKHFSASLLGHFLPIVCCLGWHCYSLRIIVFTVSNWSDLVSKLKIIELVYLWMTILFLTYINLFTITGCCLSR